MKCKLITINNHMVELKCAVEHKGETLRFNVSCTSLSPISIISTHTTSELKKILDFIHQDLVTSIPLKLNNLAQQLTDATQMIEKAISGTTIGWKTTARKTPAKKRVR